MPAGPQLQSGQRVGNYVLQTKIGEGAFSEVWKARHHEHANSVVAIKIATDPAFRRQLWKEASLEKIKNTNVVPILDSDTRFAELPYIVMPFYEGGNLSELIAQHSAGIPLWRVNWLFVEILEGVAVAHDAGIVHRDLKPSNILLEFTGDARVGDFGLCVLPESLETMRLMAPSLSLQRDTAQGLAGTLAYMAPEVLHGGPPTKAADVFSIGVMLFEMLTGRRPCGPERPGQIRRELAADNWDQFYADACSSPSTRMQDAGLMFHRYLELFPGARKQADCDALAYLAVYYAKTYSLGNVQQLRKQSAPGSWQRGLHDYVIKNYSALRDGTLEAPLLPGLISVT